MFETETALRFGSFALVQGALMLAERLIPWAQPNPAMGPQRWLPNFGLAAVGSLFLSFSVPLLAVGAAILAQRNGIGLLHWVDAPFWLAVPLTIVLMDLLIYWQRRVFHRVPSLRRLHRVHHTDPALDASSGLRFHPLEFWVSMRVRAAGVLALGAPPEAVLAFEILLAAASMFEHATIRVPGRVERAVGWLIVTPNQHRIHQSERREETDRHFGFFLSCWDRLFGTWRGRHEGELVLGVTGWRGAEEQTVSRPLVQPFRGPAFDAAAATAPAPRPRPGSAPSPDAA